MLNSPDLSAEAPWKRRFRAPSIPWSRRASLNPCRGLVCSNKDGVYQLYVWDTESGCLTQLTHQPTGVARGAISADGDFVYYLRDSRGDELGHYVRQPIEGGPAEDITPELPNYASHHIAECASGNARGFAAVYDNHFHMIVHDRRHAAPVFERAKPSLSSGPFLSFDGELAVIASSEKTGVAEYALEAWDVRSGKLIGELWDGAGSGADPGGFAPVAGDFRFAGSSNVSGHHRPFIWQPLTGERHDIQSELFAGDVTVWDWSPDGARLLLHQVDSAQHVLLIYDIAADRAWKLDAPPGVPSRGSGFRDDGALEVHLASSTAPARLLELDAATGDLRRNLINLDVDLPASAPWRSVTYPSGDGTPIQAWLATPPGDGPWPAIVHTHGGPTAVQADNWSPPAQAWLDHGFAFFSLNYRGSTTFGYDFQHAIDGNLGDLEVRDIAAGVRWLIDERIAQPEAILKTGGSYGGYLTLQSLGKEPGLWAGGMAIVAIADWTLMYEDQADTLRAYQRSIFGGTPEEKPEAHCKASPISYAAEVEAPLLVIQGENDTRCPARQMRVYEERLKALGKSIDVQWFDAGHGSLEIDEQIAQQELMLGFAYQVLGKQKSTKRA